MTDVNQDTSDVPKSEDTSEPAVDTAEPTLTDKKRAQLAAARESAKAKKRKRESDLDAMQSKLEAISEMLLTSQTPAAESPARDTKKTRRVTACDEDDDCVSTTPPPQDDGSWVTSAIRTGALLGLAAGSYYFQNVYGKTNSRPPMKKKKIQNTPLMQPRKADALQYSRVPSEVGRSGFTM